MPQIVPIKELRNTNEFAAAGESKDIAIYL